MNNIHPCLWFNGNVKEAAAFYCTIFKNSAITSDTPMVINFNLNGNKFMGINGGSNFELNPSISFFVKCNTAEETTEIYDKLAVDGKALMALDKYDWSELYGWIQDKYGLTWQVMYDANNIETQVITPSFLFTGNNFGKAEEALNLYTGIFQNSNITTKSNYPPETPFAGKLMYSEFKIDNYKMIAMDAPGEHAFTFNEAISFVVECNTQQEIDDFWAKLTHGGQELMCGWLKDKYGICWQIIPTILGKLMSDPEKMPQVLKAFRQIKKFDIAALENA